MFQGFVQLEGTIVLYLLTTSSTHVPTAATGSVSCRVFGPGGELAALAGTATAVGGVTGLYTFSIAATAANGFAADTTWDLLATATVAASGWGELLSFGVV